MRFDHDTKKIHDETTEKKCNLWYNLLMNSKIQWVLLLVALILALAMIVVIVVRRAIRKKQAAAAAAAATAATQQWVTIGWSDPFPQSPEVPLIAPY